MLCSQMANSEVNISQVLHGPVAMMYGGCHAGSEPPDDQPSITSRGEMLIGDLRIDNRDEMLSLLRGDFEEEQCEMGDAEIITAAYKKFGLNFLPKIIGEYAFVLYDSHARRLLLARDHIGARTLYWYRDAGKIVWSSQIDLLLTIVGKREIEEEYVACHLTLGPEPGITPFKNVHLVKPAHVVVVTPDGNTREKRFWRLELSRQIRYRRDEEYEDHCRALLFEAVGCGLKQGSAPIFAELSGGLDSSSIVCVADKIFESGEAKCSRVETVSHVFDNSPKSDERRFIRYVEEQRGQVGHHLEGERYRLLAPFDDESSITILNPIILAHAYHRGVSELMHASGARVLLSGHGGDEIMCSNSNPASELSDLLVQGRLWRLHNRISLWANVLKRPYVDLFWQSAVVPALSPGMQVRFKRGPAMTMPPWFNKDFICRMNLLERMRAPRDVFGFRLPSSRLQSIAYQLLVKNISGGFRQGMAPIEVNYPYLHRPLVEFMQAIPFDQKVRPGETRSLLRRALRGVLPEGIATRKDKGNPKQVIFREINRELPRLRSMFDDALVYARGYINRNEFLRALDRVGHGLGAETAALLLTISLEFWLRALESQKIRDRKAEASVEYLQCFSSAEMDFKPFASAMAAPGS